MITLLGLWEQSDSLLRGVIPAVQGILIWVKNPWIPGHLPRSH